MALTADSIETLPKDVLFGILLESDYSTVKRLCSANKRINAICQDQYFWFEKYQKNFDRNDEQDETHNWQKDYKYDYTRSRPTQGYQVMLGRINMILMVRDSEEIYELLTRIYNDDNVFNENDQQIRDALIYWVNKLIIEENRTKIYKHRGLVIQHVQNYLKTHNLTCLAPDMNTIYEWIERYYLTPSLLLKKFSNNAEVACHIYDIIHIFQYLYDKRISRHNFQQTPDFNVLLDYYRNHQVIRNRYINPDSAGDIIDKYIPQITIDQLKNIIPAKITITPINIYKL